MKRMYLLTTIILSLFLYFPFAVFASDVEVSNIATKITTEPDSSGDIWFAIKAKVKNLGHKPKVFAKLQAIDSDGFEIYDLTLHGQIKPGKSKVLTDKKYMPLKDYKQIRNWQVAE